MNNCVSISKFENDINELIKNEYSIVSLKTLNEVTMDRIPRARDLCCIVFMGGYESNYSLAFPIIQKYGIPVSIFLPPELLGLKSHTFYPHFIPHFDHQQAEQMISSGLVTIYGAWHNVYERLQLTVSQGISRIVTQLQHFIEYDNYAFFITYTTPEFVRICKQNGIEKCLLSYDQLSKMPNKDDCLWYIEVKQEDSFIDIVEQYLVNTEITCDIKDSQTNCKKHETVHIANEEETIFLKIEKQPRIRNYLRHAFPFSILEAHNLDKVNRYILNEYIDIIFKPYYNMYDYHNYCYDKWRNFICFTISKQILQNNNIDIISYVITALNSEQYCDIWLDAYYIPHKDAYQKQHLTHGILIYGYDALKDSFQALSYLDDTTYGDITITSQDLMAACNSPYFLFIRTLYVNRSFKVEYNVHTLRQKLHNYVDSNINNDGNMKYHIQSKDDLFNINASMAFPEYLLTSFRKNSKIDMICLYSFIGHKKCMMWRLSYIDGRETNNNEAAMRREREMTKLSSAVICKALKLDMMGSNDTIKQIIKSIQRMVELELEGIEETINVIDEKYR